MTAAKDAAKKSTSTGEKTEGVVYTKKVGDRTVERVVSTPSDRVAATFDGFESADKTVATDGPGSAGAGSSSRAANNAG